MRIWKAEVADFEQLRQFCEKAEVAPTDEELQRFLQWSSDSLFGVYFVAEDMQPLIACWAGPMRKADVHIIRVATVLGVDSEEFDFYMQQFWNIFLHKFKSSGYKGIFFSTESEFVLKNALNAGFEIYWELYCYWKRDFTVPAIQGLPVTIRPFVEEDLDQLVQLERGVFLPEVWNDRDSFRGIARHPHGRLLVAEMMGQVVGYIFSWVREDRVGVLSLLGVHVDYQGLGVGKQLLARGIEWLAAEQVTEMMLTVRKDNYGARALYDKFGFVHQGVEYLLRYEGGA